MNSRLLKFISLACVALAAIATLVVLFHRPAAPQKPDAPPKAAPTPEQEPVVFTNLPFLPTADGFHTAWLVSGPFDKPLAAPEKIGTPREGEPLSGRPWTLLALPQPGVSTEAGPAGTFYAAGTLGSTVGGKRNVRLISLRPARVWLNGQLAGASEPSRKRGVCMGDFDVELSRGKSPIVVEYSSDGQGAGFVLAMFEPQAGADAEYASNKPAVEQMVLALRDASAVRMAALSANATRLKPVEAWLVQEESVRLRLERTGSAPESPGDLELRLSFRAEGASAPVGKPATRRLSPAVLLEGGITLSFDAPAGMAAGPTAPMQLDCVAELAAPAGKALAQTPFALYSKPGMEAAAQALIDDARGATGPALRGDMLALAELKGEKALLLLGTALSGEELARAASEDLRAGRQALAAARAGRDALAGQVGWIERAYRSEADGSAQPYRLYVPRKLADPAEHQAGNVPLVVYLHGWVPTYDKHYWVDEDYCPEMNALADKLGAIWLAPFGRSNTDFVSIGEVDVLKAVDEVCRLYPVDRSRVSLCGYSMGGYGAYAVATHFPDRFSSMVALSGRSEPYFVERQGRAGQPNYKGYCLDVDTPRELAPMLRNLPTRVLHSRDDFIPFDGATTMVERARAAGSNAELIELTGSHWSGLSALASPEVFGWMLAQKRPERPAEVKIRTYSPRFGSAYWASVEQIDRWTEAAELTARDDGKGQLSVSTKNVREFRLSGVPFTTRIVGAEQFQVQYVPEADGQTATVRARLKAAPKAGRFAKTPALSGPMKEACNVPFIVAWGSAGTADETAANRAKAGRFALEWQRFAKGTPRVIDEKDLAETDKAARSIILFGGPATSRLAAEAAPTFGCRLTESEFEIAGKKASLAGDRGVVLTRPSPWAAANDRYLVVCVGRYYGDDQDHPATNHKLDLVPDFIVFTAGREGEGEPPAVLAGYFDTDWRADPKLVETFAPRPAPAGE